ncbi:MAG: hypothetical protein KC620_06795 [Myxococcales bacterium]|nr:hypothetical protein [Myxococcales bacterium]
MIRWPARALLALALFAGACGPLEAPESAHTTPTGPSDPLTLQVTFNEIVAAAKQGDEATIARLLEGYLLTRDELVELFGSEVGNAAFAGYNDVVASGLRREAPGILIERVGKGLTEVTVEQVGPAYPGRTTPGAQKMLDAMVKRLPMYTVRLQRPGETLGLRFDGFIFFHDRWRALLKTYAHFPKPAEAPAEAPAAPTEAPPEAPPAPAEAPAPPAEAPTAP